LAVTARTPIRANPKEICCVNVKETSPTKISAGWTVSSAFIKNGRPDGMIRSGGENNTDGSTLNYVGRSVTSDEEAIIDNNTNTGDK
jgi:hypothetical protein